MSILIKEYKSQEGAKSLGDIPRYSTEFRAFKLIAHALPLLMLVTIFYLAWDYPEFYNTSVIVQDHQGEGAGYIEHLTVIILIPAILAGLYSYLRYKRYLPSWRVSIWLLLWGLACIYFAGEEISWGQWFFHWETPGDIKTLNDQHETNLHNMSSWFDQKPRMLVELWIFIAGFVMPIWRWIRKTPVYGRNRWQYWIMPQTVCFSAALMFTLVRFAKWTDDPIIISFGNSEVRELAIATFLCIYLGSFWIRLRDMESDAQLLADNRPP